MRPIYSRFHKKLELLVQPDASTRFLLAVSGGLDSMVMWDLFQQRGVNYGIAHCNFQLRGEESDADQAFVQEQARILEVPFFNVGFDTLAFAKKQGLGIQEAARVLRYEWLEKIRKENGYSHLVTAHHADDNLETVLYNFTKGAGLKGLLGIPEKNDNLIRPLLSFPRATLELYYQSRRLSHREDSSNAEDYYNRNKIRHHIIPILSKVNPGLHNTFERTRDILADTYLLFQEQVSYWKHQVWTDGEDQISIDLQAIIDHPALATLLYEWLKEYHFHPEQLRQFTISITNQHVGAMIESYSHQLLLDRATLLLKARTSEQTQVIRIAENDLHILLPKGELIIVLKDGQPSSFAKDPNQAYFDSEALSFPLQLRHWKAGDRFAPLGMGGKHKKVQDLFSDRKLSRFDKEEVWILEDASGLICWVVGLQMDERFKIKDSTTQFYHFHHK
jgi:tRNA(Ile)-lysidine synthase